MFFGYILHSIRLLILVPFLGLMIFFFFFFFASLVAQLVKNSPANAEDVKDTGFIDPWVRKIPWKRKWQPTPVFLRGEYHGQRSLVGYSSRGCKDLDTIEHVHACIQAHTQ